MKLLDIIKEQGLGDSDIPEKKLKSIHTVYKALRKGVVTLHKDKEGFFNTNYESVIKGKYRYELPKTFDSVTMDGDIFHIHFNRVLDDELPTYGIMFYVSRINDDGTETRISPKHIDDYDMIDTKNYVLLAAINKFKPFNITI